MNGKKKTGDACAASLFQDGHPARVALDERLSAIAGMLPTCATVADIGTDHGRLGAYLLLTGKCERAVLTDVSAPSLDKARALVARLGLESRVAFAVGDGAEPLPSPPDAAVIAGMGGQSVARIVEEGRAKLGGALLVLQANVGTRALRLRLMNAGYEISDELIARAGRRWYVVIAARPGTARYGERELLAGPVLLQKKPPELLGYALFRAKVARKACAGALRGGDPAAGELAAQRDMWEEIVTWLQPPDKSTM